MTINLSEHAGGGNYEVYDPGIMTFNGASYYEDSSVTYSGNALTLIARFNIASFSGGSIQRLCNLRGGTGGYSRISGIFSANDHATTERRDKLRFLVADTSGTTICDIQTSTAVCDGSDHVVFISYDGTAGTAILYIDGVSDDDLSYSTRILTTGTSNGGTGDAFIGAINAGGQFFTGDIGYFGYADQYLTNPTDFYHPTNELQEIDETTWTEWGGVQPEFFSPNGDMENNLGSAGNMTKNGTIVSTPPSTIVIPAGLGLPTVGDAVATDIATDKVAWVDGIRVVGARSTYTNRLLSWEIGSGPAGEYVPNIADAQYAAPGVTLVGGGTATRDGTGWLGGSGLNRLIFGLPAKTTNCRRCIYTVKFDAATAYPDRFHFLMNYTDSTDNMFGRLMWASGNAYYTLEIWDADGTETQQGTAVTVTTTLDLPTQFTVVIDDWGDLVTFSVQGYETDTTQDAVAALHKWYDAGRRAKTAPNVGIFPILSTDDAASIHSIEIIDIPNL